jgi:pentose-5-phosphate-3-epimerase/CBS domain-containing protein
MSRVPIDLHIIAADPAKYYALIEALAIEYVSLQYEDMGRVADLPVIKGTKFGLAIKTETNLSVLDGAAGYDYTMLMCTTPGMSGGLFQADNFQRIIEIKQRYPKLKVQVDGGVNDEVSYILRLLGVDSIVSGSFLMNHYSIGSGMLSLHKEPSKGDYLVADYMTPLRYLPVLKENDLTFEKVLKTIEQYKQGFVLIVNEKQEMVGLISNADVRRGLIAQIDHLDKVDVSLLINRKPQSIDGRATLADMIQTINALDFIILFLPVVQDGKLSGAVLLNNLTRG